jgi:alpha-mannosidase
VAILNDCKYGWDHPDSSILRLSLIHTPGVYESWNWVGDQKSQDNGHHIFKYAIYGHKGDWRDGDVPWQAARLNQPLIAFNAPSHNNKYGRMSMLRVGSSRLAPGTRDTYLFDESNQVMVSSVKLAENGNELILRVRELYGKPTGNLEVNFYGGRASLIREVNGMEETIDTIHAPYGELNFALGPYQTKAFAFKFNTMEINTSNLDKFPNFKTINLPFNQDGVSIDSDRKDGDFDGEGNTLAGDLISDTLIHLNIPFIIGPRDDGAQNIVSCKSQNIALPTGAYNRLYVLAAAVGGPANGTFSIDGKDTSLWIQDWSMPLGQWNSRLVGDALVEEPNQIAPEYINREPVAWVGTHRHNAKGENEAYQFTYLYLVKFDLPPGFTALTLPNNPKIKILAATAVNSNYDNVTPAQPLYDVANATLTNIHADRHAFIDSARVTITCPNPSAEIHYTVDNSDPTTNASRYAGPFFINNTATVKSLAILKGADDHFVATSSFNKLIPHEAVAVQNVLPGLKSAYYEGPWGKLPNFDSLTAKKEFVTNSVAIPDFAVKEDFGLTFDGFIKIPTDGLYDFYLSSDDGSVLYIGDSLVVDNDGLHGEGDVLGEIALKAGCHPITIHMFQAKGDEALAFSMQGPGMEKQVVPKEMLFHTKQK